MQALQDKFLNGQLLLINKPIGWTSFDVVRKIHYQLKNQLELKKIKVGHAGTLDPLATGLLIICTGKFTKKIDEIQAQKKEYTGIITLGATTPSFDLEKAFNAFFETNHISDEMINEAVTTFIGTQEQTAPIHSAKKIDGKRAYELARAGEEVVIKKNTITIDEFEITQIERSKLILSTDKIIANDEAKINQEKPYDKGIHVHFRVVCSKGTYIRSIAKDLGLKLNCGGHLSALTRTKIGKYILTDAKNITSLSVI
ncbi:MAG: tRNA pseudouridine(55) synthase TruB [Vicingaceae bacterium]|nr:tRNA pseudouridine(55) synthase TruB [Flavobacteriales bacterium]MDF1675598.1 tRNA pseudouridine(55) synthase TruB [Vicingaceae bacterium]|tara:strand:+ start:73180 stop:73947 length:768 start_codon:yes stop_codon:yes gene_type:complete